VTVIMIAQSRFNSYPRHVIAFLDKTLYDNYLCLLASNKRQINRDEVKKQPENS